MVLKALHRKICCNQRGQMTIEMAVAFPVILAMALVVYNAMFFFSVCATFDRAANHIVRVAATSPGFRQNAADCAALVRQKLELGLPPDWPISTEVHWSRTALDHLRFVSTVHYRPSLFGLPLSGSVMGVTLPSLSHSTTLVVDSYKPGVIV